MSNPNRLYFTFANHQHDLRVQPHREDDALIVIKSKHPEAVDHFVELAGMNIGIKSAMKGSNNFITIADKELVASAVAIAILKVEEPAAPTFAANLDDDDDEIDGDELDPSDYN